MAEGEATTSQMNQTLTEQNACPLCEGATETLHGQKHAARGRGFVQLPDK